MEASLRPAKQATALAPRHEKEIVALGKETAPTFPKRSPVAGTMDQVRPQDGQWHCDHAYLDWSALSSLRPHQVAAMRRPRTEARPGERMSQVEEGLFLFTQIAILSDGCSGKPPFDS